MDAKQVSRMSDDAVSSQEAAAREKAAVIYHYQYKARQKARTRADADITDILLRVEQTAERGGRSLEVSTGHSKDINGIGAAYGEAVRAHMEARGYKAEQVTHEPCESWQTNNTYCWRFSW